MTEEERTNHEKHNHYIRSFREEKAQTVRAREHTAALSTELRQQIEQEFSEKKINVISCTTTMELGVDLGELEAVVCLNIPPGISNYQQRTGRAGRRAQAAPFCVTIARNSQYDQAVYREFENYLRHPAAVPRVHLANAQLFQRHQNSVIISAFLRNCIKDLTINAPSLTDLFGQDFDENAYQLFRECIYSWLDSQNGKEAIDEAGHLGNTLPADLASGVSLSGMALKMLFAKEMTMFAQEVKERWLLYSKKWNEFYEARNIRMVSHWENLRKKYMRQFLIDQLSTRGLIPTYSFPVHTLTLEVTKETGQRGNFYDDREISLSRDAVLGISEYAPGSEVVANGRIWTSEGLAYYPRMFMPTRYYCLCPECRHVDIGEDTNDLPANCSFCGSNKGRFHRSFIEPKGFVTAYENRKGKDPSRNRVRKQYAEEARLISSARSDQYVATDIPSIQKVLLRGHSRAEEVPVGTLFIVNRGPFGVGYHRCNICNYMIPAHKMAKVKQRHTELLSEKNCWNEELTWPIDLSHIFNTDVCIFRFLGRIPLQERSENNRQRLQNYYDSFSRTFSEALRFAAVDLLNIEPGELLATYKMHDGYLEAILYDAVSGGAGYAVRIFQEIKLKTLLNRSVKLLDCPDHCSRACRSCLCDYSNQRLWDTFDRKPVLEWSRKLSVEMSEHPYLRMGGILWERPSLEILSEKLAAYRKIHLTSRRLFAQRSGDSDTLPLKWLLDMMNRGCIFHIYLSEPLEFSKSSLDIGQKKVMSYLRPYIEHKQLIINQLPDEDGGMFIPRVFTKPESGQSAWFSGYPVPAILNEILPSPVYQVNLNHEQAGDLKEFIEGAKAYPTDIISESPLLKHWEIKAGEQRNLKDYFSSIKNAYIDELIIKDPYCGSGERQKDALGKFMKEICLLATTVKKVTVQCREQSYKNPTYEYPTKMRESIMKLLEPITTGKKAEIEIRVLDFSTSRAFHDRSVQINIIDPEGEKKVHLYDLSGGIDFLMDEKVDTKIYYFKDI